MKGHNERLKNERREGGTNVRTQQKWGGGGNKG
jgi:hypothetical protein